MSPIEYIEEGIKTGNWETVCEGFERLTGRSLPLPVEKPGEITQAKEALQKIISIASEVVEPKSPKKKSRGRPKGSVKKKKSITNNDGEDNSLNLDENNKTIVQKEIGKIQLITNEPDAKEIEKNKIKAKNAQTSKAKLSRKTGKVYDVECNECGETFKSERPKGKIGQKCPKCLRDKKSRFGNE